VRRLDLYRILEILCLFAVLLVAGCASKLQSCIMVNMIKQQEKYFTDEVLPEFDRENRTVTQVKHYDDVSELEKLLDKDRGLVSLVTIPSEKTWSLFSGNALLPIDSIMPNRETGNIGNIFVSTDLGKFNGRQYLIPRRFETRIMVYSKSRVAEALSMWRNVRDSVSADLKAVNGYGLPATYILENDPDKWNFFDIYTLGWIWSHEPYKGVMHGRIAYTNRLYPDIFQSIIDRILLCGGDSTNIMTMKGQSVTDAFLWESVFALSCYDADMWKEGWISQQVLNGFGSGDVFLSFMTQMDCFFLHGTGQDGLGGYMKNPDDMGIAQMPQGCSIQLDENGNVLRYGSRSVYTRSWWWGIPESAPDPVRSYRLARYLTDTKIQINDCSRVGMIPARKDLLGDIQLLFGDNWITALYRTSFRQLVNNGPTVLPVCRNFNELVKLYRDAWYDIVVERNWSENGKIPDWNYINSLLDRKYAPVAFSRFLEK
jgi:hypothetical protein